MSGLGSGSNGQLTFIDIISVISFLIGIENLELNATQDDMARVQQELADKADKILTEIHQHLEEQDRKIDSILEVIKREDHQNVI